MDNPADPENAPRAGGDESLSALVEHYRELVENANDIIYTHDFEGTFTSLNRTGERLTGYSREEAIGRHISTLLEEPWLSLARQMTRAKLEGRETATTYELPVRCKDGHQMWLEVNTRILYRNGQPHQVLGIARDVTDRKKAEDKLRSSEELVRAAFEASPDCIIIKRLADGMIIAANEGFRRITGLDPKQAIGHTPLELGLWVDPEERDRIRQLLVRDGAVDNLEARIRHVDGSVRTTLFSARILQMGDDARILSVVRDVSDWKAAAEELRANRQRLDTLLSNLPGMIYRCRNNQNWTMEFISDGVQRLAGYEPAAFLAGASMSFADIIHPDDREMVWAGVQKAVAEGRPYRLTYRILTRNGEQKWIWEQGQQVADNQDPQGSILEGLMVDITEQKRLEDQLQQAQRMDAVGRLAGGLAHEFNNLLTVINGFARLAAAKVNAQDPLRPYLDEIIGAGQRAADITGQLLTMSRRQIVTPRHVDLNSLIGEMEWMLPRLLGERIHLLRELSGGPLWVFADPAQLKQVILNLVLNARDAMPKGGRLLLRTARLVLDAPRPDQTGSFQGPCALLTVSDTGIGMDETTKARIFEPFYTTKPGDEGTGLGLSIVYGIVQQAGGWVEADSTPGLGSTFRIYLPLAGEPEPAEAAAEAERTPAGPMQAAHILVADDEEGVRRFLAGILTSAGFRVTQAADGQQALDAMEAERPDLLILDLVMPEKEGIETIQEVHQRHPNLPVIAISGAFDARFLVVASRLGAHATLRKPLDAETVIRKVRELLRSKT